LRFDDAMLKVVSFVLWTHCMSLSDAVSEMLAVAVESSCLGAMLSCTKAADSCCF